MMNEPDDLPSPEGEEESCQRQPSKERNPIHPMVREGLRYFVKLHLAQVEREQKEASGEIEMGEGVTAEKSRKEPEPRQQMKDKAFKLTPNEAHRVLELMLESVRRREAREANEKSKK